jgi:hypothetical protein
MIHWCHPTPSPHDIHGLRTLRLRQRNLPTHGLPGRNLLCASLSSIRREVWYADLGKLKLIRLAHLDCWNLDRGDLESERAGLQNLCST